MSAMLQCKKHPHYEAKLKHFVPECKDCLEVWKMRRREEQNIARAARMFHQGAMKL